MARKEYLYYLLKGKKALWVDNNGAILESDDDLKKPNGQLAHLRFDPIGWRDVMVKYARNIKYWGLVRDMTVPMTFVKDGADILRYRFWNGRRLEEELSLGMMKLDRYSLGYKYKPYYLSDLNFPKFRDSESGFTVEALEGGPSKYLKANENTVYEVEIDEDPQHFKVLMDGRTFGFSRTFGVVPDQKITGTADYYMGMIESAQQGNPPDVLFQDILPMTAGGYPNANWFMSTDKARTVKISIVDLEVYFDKSVSPLIRIETNDGTTGGFPQFAFVPFAPPEPAGSTKKYNVTLTINMPANTKYNFKLAGGSGSDPTTQYTVKSGDVQVDYDYKYDPTYVNCIYAYRLFEKLVEKMTEGKYGVRSNYLQAMKDMAITCGDALRGFLFDDSDPLNIIAGPRIKISFSSFFKSIPFIGLAVDGDKIVIERLDDFFKDEVMLDLGQVTGADMVEAEDLIVNKLLAGYEEQDYDGANGRYETNQGQRWSTPITRVVKDLDLVSPIRVDSTGAELLRVNYDNKESTDSSSDNDTFALNITDVLETVDGIDFYRLLRPVYTSVTGQPYWEDDYNMEWSPKKQLLKWSPLLHSIFDGLDGDTLTLLDADKNKEQVTELGSVTIAQKEPIQIGSLLPKLFLPYYLNFTTQVPENVLELIQARPYGKIRFRWNDRTWYGFLMDGGVKPATNDTQVWKLLSAPENDLYKFNKR